jgi:ribosome maturation factor RimP
MANLDNIKTLLTPSIDHLGYEVVRLKWFGGNGPKTLQLMIEPKDGSDTKVEDCEKVSNQVAAILDVEDVIKDAYRLEVSSPGIDRPLTRLKDFANWQGFEAKLETNTMIDGRRRFRGKVVAVNDNIIDFELRDEKLQYKIPYESVLEAKLVLTDELINYVTKDKEQ